ncbi:MAG: galactokinase [Terrimicrobiaceae bacterium]|nr:galactokinase [Terrimicrobiaceae bacterium]
MSELRVPFEVSAFAPGRVELLGNHTDYNAGVVLSAAIQLGVSAAGRRRDDGRIVLTSEGIDGVVAVDRASGLKPRDSWEDYPLGVAEMLAQAGAQPGGFEAQFSATLPAGAGLSSSAALEVATAVLLNKLYPFELTPMELAKLCRRAENEFVGVSCGLLDQVSSIFGERDRVVFLDCRAESVETIPFPENLGLLIVHSGVKHALTGGEYNERRDQCFEAARRMGVPALRDVTSAQLESANLPDLVRRRAAHVVGENERVMEALGHLRAGRGTEFGRLMTASHASSRTNFENSTPELDALVEIAVAQTGCHGARLTGGGFGGAIVALVERTQVDQIGEAIVKAYAERTGHTARAYPCVASDGALTASR